MNYVIINAIETRSVLTITYKGETRTIEPHAYGVSKKGEPILRAYQTTATEGWKLFLVGNMSDAAPAGLTFPRPREGYRQGDSAMTTIYAQLPQSATLPSTVMM